jgi:hypothetical protein
MVELSALLRGDWSERFAAPSVVMEASGICTDPVYYALCEQDFEQVAVINPAYAKAL